MNNTRLNVVRMVLSIVNGLLFLMQNIRFLEILLKAFN